MAKFESDAIAEYIKQLNKMGAPQVTTAIIKMAVYDGAAIVADVVRPLIPKDSGDLANSMFLAKMENEDGFIYTRIGFAGYDSKGTPNQIKANVLEHGRSDGKGKHPFIRKAVNACGAQAVAAMEARLDTEFKKLMEE